MCPSCSIIWINMLCKCSKYFFLLLREGRMLPEWLAGSEGRARWRRQWRRWRCWPPPAPWSAAPRGRCSWGSSRCRHPGTGTRRRSAWSRYSRSPGPCWRCWSASSPRRAGSPGGRSRAGSLRPGLSPSWSGNKKWRVRTENNHNNSLYCPAFGTFYLSDLTCYINQTEIDYQVLQSICFIGSFSRGLL